MDRSVRVAPSFSMRLGRYAAALGALPSVLCSMKELRAIAEALDRAEAQRESDRALRRAAKGPTRSAA